MLFILFGCMAEIGHESRSYFMGRGFEFVRKKYYVPSNAILKTYYHSRDPFPLEEVTSCDFVYENNGMVVGFNKKQIIDAVRGRKDVLLTLLSYTVDFVRVIKRTHGEYVTVIGCYVDRHEMERMTRALPGITDAEVQLRMSLGLQVHRIMSEERDLFDEVAIYGGEDTPFDFESLAGQYKHMIQRAKLVEHRLNNAMYVELPYTGNKPYVFASYAHSDESEVLPVLSALQRMSCRIWYDEGIYAGDAWRVTVASKIESCACFLLFSSERSTLSPHVCAEINAALTCQKRIIPVRLDDARFRLDQEMYLDNFECLSGGDPLIAEKVLAVATECVGSE